MVTGPSTCWHCSRAIWWRSDQWAHVNGSATCCAPNGDRLDATPRPAPCAICGRGFSVVEWDNRHTDPDDGVSDIHAECCRWCEKVPHAERASDVT